MDAQVVRPEFADLSLRKALDEVGPQIESFTQRLDKLSSDIKQLEAYLEKSGIRIEVEVLVGGYRGADESLLWEKGEPDRWRVMYRCVQESASFRAEEITHCALIEAPVDARLRVRKTLPELLRQVAQAARTDGEAPADDDVGDGPPPSDDDIPF